MSAQDAVASTWAAPTADTAFRCARFAKLKQRQASR
jgi:hypothetical protein